ncbi:MAG: RDD family protein [Nitrospirae bacterium]|nr:RDD family protein [Nitrospirota bacterium]
MEGLTKASILNRTIAKTIDFIIVGALLETIPKVGYFAGLTYLLICDGLFDGRSIGKRLIGLKVVNPEAMSACGFRESIIRNFPFAVGYILMVIPLIGFIFPAIILTLEGLLMIGSSTGMRLGDELAKTQVIEEKTVKQENRTEKIIEGG